MARSGTEILIGTVCKALGLDPQLIMAKVDEIRQVVQYAGASIGDIKANQEIIIAQQRAILAHLGDEHAEDGTEHGGRKLAATGRRRTDA